MPYAEMLVPLLVVDAIALTSALLGFCLYRFGESRVVKPGIRLTGAAAIAIVFFSFSSGLYLRLAPRHLGIAGSDKAVLQETLREFDECYAQEGDLTMCRPLIEDLKRYCQGVAGLVP
jgi:hypothetical protein